MMVVPSWYHHARQAQGAGVPQAVRPCPENELLLLLCDRCSSSLEVDDPPGGPSLRAWPTDGRAGLGPGHRAVGARLNTSQLP
eukprot:scaffold1146_cov399-Prasinococcus_capsulatus_cf.AAC.40